jgi:hypothetical protein
MKRRMLAAAVAVLALAAAATPAVAWQPPGLHGYEGQPGNQGNH